MSPTISARRALACAMRSSSTSERKLSSFHRIQSGPLPVLRGRSCETSYHRLSISQGDCFYLRALFFQERELMQIHFTDFVTAANLLVLLGIYRKMSIIVYQHKLMWTDFAERKGISANGKHAASV
jgi:hypothetical protein